MGIHFFCSLLYVTLNPVLNVRAFKIVLTVADNRSEQ